MANRTRSERCRIYTLRAAVNLFVVAVLISCFYCIYIATVFSQRKQAEVTTLFSILLHVLTFFLITSVCAFRTRVTFCWSWWWNIYPLLSSHWQTLSHRWSSTSSSVLRIILLPLRSASHSWGIMFTCVFSAVCHPAEAHRNSKDKNELSLLSRCVISGDTCLFLWASLLDVCLCSHKRASFIKKNSYRKLDRIIGLLSVELLKLEIEFVLCQKLNWYRSVTNVCIVIRCVFMRLASIGVLLFSLWSQITCGSSHCSCGYNHQRYPVRQHTHETRYVCYTSLSFMLLCSAGRLMSDRRCTSWWSLTFWSSPLSPSLLNFHASMKQWMCSSVSSYNNTHSFIIVPSGLLSTIVTVVWPNGGVSRNLPSLRTFWRSFTVKPSAG